MVQSETQIGAVPTSADSWTDLTNFTVPAGVKRLCKVRFAIAPDVGTSATSVRQAPVFRLTGSGLLEQNPHEYLGPFGGQSMVTSGGVQMENMAVEYDVDIPVQTGGIITVSVNTLDEAITAGTVMANLYYDDKDVSAANCMSQYVDAAAASTADVWTAVGTLTVPAPAPEKSPKKIRAVCIGVALDQGTSAISLRTAPRIRLTGSGIGEGGSHEFIGPTAASAEVTAGAVAYSKLNARIEVDIPVSASGAIVVEQRFDGEVPTAGTIAVGLLYA
jgi:hypothetical protein